MHTHNFRAKRIKVVNNYRGSVLSAEEETFLNLLRRQDKDGRKLLNMISELIKTDEEAQAGVST